MTWIPIEEKAPPNGENVILFDGNEVFCGYRYSTCGGFDWSGQGCDGICYGWYEKDPITHWMPLPEPPDGCILDLTSSVIDE